MSRAVRFGLNVPNVGDYADPRLLAELAHEAEDAGWDGFFVWDHMLYRSTPRFPAVDPWVALAAVALRTRRVRIGALVTPVARRRPWKLARETVTLDLLSGGRLVFGAGLGTPADVEFATFGEDADARVRAAKLDEGLDILVGLWSGALFRYEGAQYRVAETVFLPAPVQRPRIPVWIAGHWPNRAPFHRAARWDGVYPTKRDAVLDPAEVREVVAFTLAHRPVGSGPLDVVVEGRTSGADPSRDADHIARYGDAGVTWWIEYVGPKRGPLDEMRARIRTGPPGS